MGMKRHIIDSKKTIIVFLMCLAASLIVLCKRTGVTLNADRIGDMASPAYLAGLHWEDLVSQTQYYGFGFKWIFFVLFKISDNPFHIYAAIQLFYAFAYSLVYALLYGEGRKYWKLPDNIGTMLLFPALCIIFEVHPMSSEPTLFLSYALLALFFLKTLRANGKWRNIYSIIVPLWLCYMITLHERSLAVVIGFVIVVVFDWIYRRQCAFNWKLFAITLIAAWLLQSFIIKNITVILWGTQDLRNTSAIPTSVTFIFRNLRAFKVFIGGIISNIISLTIRSEGLILVGIFLVLFFVIRFIRRRPENRENYEANRGWIMLLFISALTIVITIVGISLNAARSAVLNSNPYGFKFFTYVRYYFSWTPVCITAVWALWPAVKDRLALWIKVLMPLVQAVFVIVFMKLLFPFLKGREVVNELTNNTFRMYNVGNLYRAFSSDDHTNILISGIISILIIVIFILNWKLSSLVTAAVLFAVILYGTTAGFKLSGPQWKSKINEVYAVIRDVSAEAEIARDIYTEEELSNNTCTLQFLLNGYSVHNTYPDLENTESLVITWSDTNAYANWLKARSYHKYKVGQGQYIWSKNDRISELIERRLSGR